MAIKRFFFVRSPKSDITHMTDEPRYWVEGRLLCGRSSKPGWLFGPRRKRQICKQCSKQAA